jgi:type I restriction enzyme S subunit
VPAHWEERRAKFYFREVDERSETGEEELLSVSHITGVTPRSQKDITMFMAESYEGYKTCKPGDLVINIMWAWMGALGVSEYSGIISSAYCVYRQQDTLFQNRYLDYLGRVHPYIAEYTCRSTGIRSSRLRMYTDDFFDMPIVCPPLDEQIQIIKYIDDAAARVDQAIAQAEREIELMQEYRTTLISDVVTGKVDVREHAAEPATGEPL